MLAFLTLSTIALAAQSEVVLLSSSDDNAVNEDGISFTHFGAGINGASFTRPALFYGLNSDGTVYEAGDVVGGPPFVLGELFNELVSEAGGIANPVHVIDGYLTVNGSNSVFYACDHVEWDPYGYINPVNKGVGIYNTNSTIPPGCEPIKISA